MKNKNERKSKKGKILSEFSLHYWRLRVGSYASEHIVSVNYSDGDYFCYTRHEPVGVCGQIIPVRIS